MATEGKEGGQPGGGTGGDKYSSRQAPPETQVGDGNQMSIDMGADNLGDVRTVDQRAPGMTSEAGTGKTQADDPLRDDDLDGQDEGLDDGADEGEAEGDKGEKPDPLPAFDGTPEVAKAYDARYMTKDGNLNEEALGEQWYANATGKDGKVDLSKGGLSEDTYKWFESKGISRAVVKAQEKATLALKQVQAARVFEVAGGQQNYASAIQWARQGGYTKEQQAAFNRAVNGSNDAARDDAVEMLMVRHRRANPGQRGVRPERTTQGASGQGQGVAGYKDYAEYQKDFREARANKDNAKLQETRRRLKASDWYGKG
jgi:hypothetical protein